MKNIIFIAPPASGKGTQSDMLVSQFGYEHISTGNLLRSIADEDTPFGNDIKTKLKMGELISDDIVNELLRNTLMKLGDKKFILDGYPRKLNQAKTLDIMLKELNITDWVAIYLNIERDMAMQRSLGRITCNNCGASFNKYYEKLKPQQEGICDKCNSHLEQRSDDNIEAFNKRFENYLKNTEPILNFYQNLGLLREVKVEDEKDDTYRNLKIALEDV